MNIKKLLSITLIAVCSMVFCACGFTPLSLNPNTNDTVYSNGGIAVQKGQFIYFMNGFESQADLESGENKYGEVQRGGIYRVKLDNGNLMYKANDELDDTDKTEEIDGIECVVPKVAGYENGSLYIFDDNLFYTSPNAEKDKYGKLQNALVDFYMVNINGSGNKRLYISNSEFSNVTYGMKKYKDSVYLLILDGTDLYKLTITNGTFENSKKIASGITKAVWNNQSTYVATQNYNDSFDEFVYYTTNAEEGVGNILNKVSIVSDAIETIVDDKQTTYDLKCIDGSKLFYTTKVGDVANVLYSNNVLSTDFKATQSEELLYNSYANYYAINGVDYGYVGGLLASDSTNGTRFVKNGTNTATVIASSEAHNLLFANDSKIWTRTSTSMIYEIDLSQDTISTKAVLSPSATAKTDGAKYVDSTNRYIFYYGEYKNSESEAKYYMHIIDTLTIDPDTELAKDMLIASLEKVDIITDEE